MLNEIDYSYKRVKREARLILARIENKHYGEMKKERSSGFSICAQFHDELSRSLRRAQTEKIHSKDQQQIKNCRRIKTEKMDGIENHIELLQKKNSLKIEKQEAKKIIENQKINPRAILKRKALKQSIISQKAQFLPMLTEMIKQKEIEKCMTVKEKTILNLITQMMIICLQRKQNRKLEDSMETALEIMTILPEINTKLKLIKQLWLKLIGKIYLDLNANMKQQIFLCSKKKGAVLQENSFSRRTRCQRKSSIIIKSLASKKVFMNKCVEQMKKSSLVYESSYLKERGRKARGLKKEDIICKVNNKLLIAYPEPCQVFPLIESIINYDLIVVCLNEDTHLFPYHYPDSLREVMTQREYVSQISKFNSVLIPETKCFEKDSCMYILFEPLLLLFIFLLLTVILIMIFASSSVDFHISAITAVTLCISIIFIQCIFIHNNQSNLKNVSQVYHRMALISNQWEQRFKQQQLRVFLNASIQAIIIALPRLTDDSSNLISHPTKYVIKDFIQSSQCHPRVTFKENLISDQENFQPHENYRIQSPCYSDSNPHQPYNQIVGLKSINPLSNQPNQTHHCQDIFEQIIKRHQKLKIEIELSSDSEDEVLDIDPFTFRREPLQNSGMKRESSEKSDFEWI